MNNYTEILEKAQTEFLSGLKQAQELNVKAIAIGHRAVRIERRRRGQAADPGRDR